MGDSAPEPPSPVWSVERLSSSAMQVRAHKRLSTRSAMQGRGCLYAEIPGIFSHLICTSLICCPHAVPWHPWEAAAQRHLPECHRCHPTPPATCLEANLSWRTDNLYVPCTYHPQHTAQPPLFGSVQGTANLTSAPQPGLTFWNPPVLFIKMTTQEISSFPHWKLKVKSHHSCCRGFTKSRISSFCFKNIFFTQSHWCSCSFRQSLLCGWFAVFSHSPLKNI